MQPPDSSTKNINTEVKDEATGATEEEFFYSEEFWL